MKTDTVLTTAGRDPASNHGIVNPPVYHASTVLFPTLAALDAANAAREPGRTYYGRSGTPTTFALEDAVCELEGGHRTLAVGSGVAALVVALLAFVKTGDNILVVDCVYGPIRKFCDTALRRLGISTTYFDPSIGGAIKNLFAANTRAILLEPPGSLTFEMQDVPAITRAAREAGIMTIADNTWATPYYFKPLAHGVDVSVQAATKYLAGHSDLMMGTITTTREAHASVRRSVQELGACAAPDDCFLALRGLRTLGVRLPRHQATGLALARWLKQQPEVSAVLHPALPDDPGHVLWRRDFSGACGLFAFTLRPTPRPALAAMVDSMRLFGMGFSWGGFESLILPSDPRPIRSARPWADRGELVRVHAGLEDPDDLIADLTDGFARLRAAIAAPARSHA